MSKFGEAVQQPAARPAVLVIGASADRRREIASALANCCDLGWASSIEEGGGEAAQPYDVCIFADETRVDSAEEQVMLLHSTWAEFDRRMPILTLCADEEAAQRWLAAGADEVLFAPLRAIELRARVGAAQRLACLTTEFNTARRNRASQAQTLLALLEISTAGAQDEFGEEALERITAVAAQLSRSQRAALLLPADDGRSFVIAEAVGREAAEIRRTRLPSDCGVVAEAIATKAPVCVRSHGGRSAEAFQLPWKEPGEYIAVPVQAGQGADGKQFTGALLMGTPSGGAYDAGNEQALELVANFAGTTITGLLSRFWREEARDALVLALVELTERRDNDTARHLDRVAAFSLILAEELRGQPRFPEIDDTFVGELRRAVPLHDIGKVAIPDSILLKPGRLTDAEMQVMRTHASIGGDAIASVRRRLPNSTFARFAEDIARHHHEWFDGNGYPDRRSGLDIPLAARIVAVADVYDALTTKRVYKPALSHEAAHDIIVNGTGTQFDPLIVEAFRRREQDFRRFAEALSDDREEIDPSVQSVLPIHWFLSASTKPLGFLHVADSADDGI